MFGFITGFLTGNSSTRGTGRAVAVTLLAGGVIASVLTFVTDVETAGQFLFSFSLGFFVGLLVGHRLRSSRLDITRLY